MNFLHLTVDKNAGPNCRVFSMNLFNHNLRDALSEVLVWVGLKNCYDLHSIVFR